MPRIQSLVLGLGCITALLGGCGGGVQAPPAPTATAGSTPTAPGTAGSTPGAAGTTPGAAGSTPTGASGAGTTGGAAGTKPVTAGTGAAGMSMVTAGMGAGGTGGSTPAATGNGFKMCGKPAKEGMCKAKGPGVYAMKVDIDVYFQDENNDPTLFDPGRGVISVFLKGDLSEVCEDGSGGVGTIQTCGDIIPPLVVDANCSVIQILFPDEMWDKPTMPKITTTGSSSGFNPGDILSFAKAAGIYGIDLDATAKWPTFMETTTFTCKDGKKGMGCFPDHDGDGNPGITVKLKQDGTPSGIPYECGIPTPWTYIPAPISTAQAALMPTEGAVETYIGLRTAIAGGGKIGADCMSGVGPAEADGFESRLFDCKLKDGSKCKAADANFVDKNLPTFHVLKAGEMPPATWKHPRADADMKLNRAPSKGPVGAVVRLGDPGGAVTCEQVRKATFPTM